MLNLNAAAKEISEKTDSTIQIETAYKWASRSIVCYRLFVSTGKLTWLQRAEDYRHEAIEHASLAEDDYKALRDVTDVLREEAGKATASQASP